MAIFQTYVAFREFLGLKATSLMGVPVGSTAQRPTGGDLIAGSFRFNSTLGTIEWYTGSSWAQPAGGGAYTDEQAQDAAALLIQNGVGISWSYNDGANTLTPTVSLATFTTSDLAEGSRLYYLDERVDDRVAALLQAGAGISLTYNDVGNSLTIANTNTQYTDEMAQDAIGAMVSSEFTYTDATPLLAINAIAATKVTTDATHRFITDTQLTNFQSGYDNQVVSAAFTGTTTKTLTLTQQDGGTITANFTDNDTGGGGGTVYTFSTGLTESPAGTVKNDLITGKAGGQTITGGTGTGENLTLVTTSHASKGKILFGTSGNYVFDSPNGRFGIGQGTPTAEIHIEATSGADKGILVKNTGTGSGDTAVIKLQNSAYFATLFVGTASGSNIAGIYTQAPQGFGIYNSGVTQIFKVDASGNVLIPAGTLTVTNLGGTGTRMVVASSTGLLSTQAIGGGGTVTNFSAGDLSPLFTTTEATTTSTPALSFALTNAAAATVFGNFTNSSGAPSYNAAGSDNQILVRRSGALQFGALVAGDIVGGSGNYIQNQSASAQSAANAWVSGSLQADTSFITGLSSYYNGGGYGYMVHAGIGAGGFKMWVNNGGSLAAQFNWDQVVTLPGALTVGSGGAGLPVGNKLNILHDLATTSGTQIMGVHGLTQTVATTGTTVGNEVYIKSTHTTGTVTDMRSQVLVYENAGTAAVTEARVLSVGGLISNASSGTISTLRHVYSQLSAATSATGTITNFYAFYNDVPGGSGTATVTNRWAFFNNDANATSHIKGALQLPSLGSTSADKLVGILTSSGDVAKITLGTGLSLSSNTLSVSGFVTGASNLGSGVPVWHDQSGTTLRFKTVTASTMTGVAEDGGLTITDNTTSGVDFKNSEYDIAGKHRFSTNSSSLIVSGKLFQNLPATSAGIIEIQISGYDTISTGSWTTIRRISFKVISGTPSVGAPSTAKTDENLGTFGTPTVGWTVLNGWPEVQITPANSNLTLWNVSYNVSLVRSDL